jgi:hypothetical protein
MCYTEKRGYFCSRIANTKFAQYYKIVFVAYFGETLKMCSNVFYILISVNRYMLIGQEHALFLEKISKLDLKRTIIFTVAFSMLLNIGHWDQYEINYRNDFFFSNTIEFYPNYPLGTNSTYFAVWSLIYFLVNFVVFLAINTLIEIMIVRRLHA